MNKLTTLLLVLFVALGVGAWWFSQNGKPKTTLNAQNDWYMAVDDVTQIHKVFFANRNGETVTIVRNGDHWIYNDQYKARPNAVSLVMEVLKQVRLQYRPPASAVDNAVKFMATQGIKVEVYDKNGQNLRTLYVGGTTQDERGTYMMLDGANNPYVMHLPAWEGSLRARFFFGEEKWRDKTIFSEKPENITSVRVNYPDRKNQSFVLERTGEVFDIRPFYEETPKKVAAVDQSRIAEYLKGYKRLGAEGFENDNKKVAALCTGTPFSTISLTNKQGENTTVSMFPLYEKDDNGKPFPNQKLERYVAKSSTGDYYLIQQLVFGKIFWSYDGFFTKVNKD